MYVYISFSIYLCVHTYIYTSVGDKYASVGAILEDMELLKVCIYEYIYILKCVST
jgi:hypothetical protein